MSMRRANLLVPAAVLAAHAGGAFAGAEWDHTIQYTKIPTHPTSVVPGALDLNGDPALTNFRALEDFILSPDGTRAILKGRTQQGTDLENIMLLLSFSGGAEGVGAENFAQEGQPIHGALPGEIYDFFGSGLGRFNEMNQFAYSARARGGSASIFQKVLRYDGGATPIPADFFLEAQMGDPYTGLVDLPPNPSGDELVGNSIGSIHILNDGRIGAQDSTIQNIHSTRRPAIFYDLAMFHQTGVTMATWDGNNFVWETMDLNGFYTSADGTRWVCQGEIATGSTADDDVLVVGELADGNTADVVIRESFEIPGTGVVASTIVESGITANGLWFARGAIAGGGVYAVVEGVVVAKTGDPITEGSGEHWGTSFLSLSVNENGEWLLVGTTDSADPAADTVMVFNGQAVVAREGDPLMLDDGAAGMLPVFIGRATNTLSAFEPNDSILAGDGTIHSLLSINDGAGNDYNSNPAFGAPQAYVIFTPVVPPACPGDLDGDNDVDSTDLNFVLSGFGCTGGGCPGDADGDGDTDTTDLNIVLSAFGTVCE